MPTDSQTIAAYSPKEGDQSAFYNFQAKTDRHTTRIPHKTSQNAIIPAATTPLRSEYQYEQFLKD